MGECRGGGTCRGGVGLGILESGPGSVKERARELSVLLLRFPTTRGQTIALYLKSVFDTIKLT